MDEKKLLERITVNPDIFGGKPIIRGERLSVQTVLEILASGQSTHDLLADFPWLEQEDIQACLLYASRVAGNERFEPVILDHAS